MGFLQNLRDKFITEPVANQILEKVRSDNKQPSIFQVPFGFNGAMQQQNKRMISGNSVDFNILRALSVNHETSRAAINVRKRQISQLDFEIVDTDEESAEQSKTERYNLKKTIMSIGGDGIRFRELLDQLVEDVLVLDGLVFYKQRTRGGKLLRIIPVDPATIKLRVDQSGARPIPPEIAFEQWIHGEKVAELTTKEMVYERMNPRSSSPYGLSPLETLIMTVDSSLKASLYNANYLSDNNIPQGFLSMPEGWTPQQIKEYKEFFDSILSGSKATSKVFPIPAGANYQPTTKPTDFSFAEFFDYLDRKVCMLFDITPQELGLSLKQYKENADSQDKIQSRKGIKPLANFLNEIFTDIIQDELGFTKYKFKFVGLDGRFTTADAQALIPIGVLGIDEFRVDIGLPKLGIDNVIINQGSIMQIDKAMEASNAPEMPTEPQNDTKPTEEKTKMEKSRVNTDFKRVFGSRKAKAFKKGVLSDIEKQLSPFGTEETIKNITGTKKADEINNDEYFDEELVTENVNDTIQSVSFSGAGDYLQFSVDNGVNVASKKLNKTLPNQKYRDVLGERETYIIDSVNQTSKDYIITAIKNGKLNGQTNAEIARRIRTEIPDIAKYRSEMIVRTETSNAMVQAENRVYKEQGIIKVQWRSDSNACPECAELDGQIDDVDGDFRGAGQPGSIHPNCECMLDPILD